MRFSRRSLSLLPALLATGAVAQPSAKDGAPALKLVVLDIGGTLIGDHGEVPDAMLGAFSRHGITVTPQEFSGAGRTGDSRALTLSHSGTAQRNEAGK